MHLELTDTPGQDEYELMRVNPFSGGEIDQLDVQAQMIGCTLFSEAEVFLVCFSLVNRDSYENVRNKWMEEIR